MWLHKLRAGQSFKFRGELYVMPTTKPKRVNKDWLVTNVNTGEVREMNPFTTVDPL